MADDQSQRPYRSNDVARGGQARAPGAGSGSDPLAELARLIGQSDPFGEYSREAARRTGAEPAAPPAHPAAYAAPGAARDAQQPYGAPDYDQQPPYAAPSADALFGAGGQGYAAEEQVPAYLARHAQAGGQAEQVGGYGAQGGQGGQGGYEHDPYYQSKAAYNAEEEDFYDDVPHAHRRTGVLVIAGIFALAIIGTAGAFGYRALFGSSGTGGQPPVIKAETAPSKIVPASAGKDAASNKLITDRVGGSPQGEQLVSREEQPVAMKDKPAGVIFPQNQRDSQQTAALGSGIVGSEPKKIRTIAILPDQSTMADSTPVSAAPPAPEPPARQAPVSNPAPAEREPAPRAAAARPAPAAAAAPAPSNAPLSLNPNAQPTRPAPAPAPARTASAAPTQLAPSGGNSRYAVQVSSQRSEADAQAAYRSLQGKFPNQLGGRQPFIHRVDLGAKGIYFRAMVGPFANANEASELCSSLKAAGGQCIVQRN